MLYRIFQPVELRHLISTQCRLFRFIWIFGLKDVLDEALPALLELPVVVGHFYCLDISHQIGFKQFRSEQRSTDQNTEDLEAQEVTAPDHRVELHGHVVGIALDHSGRFLFANVRR